MLKFISGARIRRSCIDLRPAGGDRDLHGHGRYRPVDQARRISDLRATRCDRQYPTVSGAIAETNRSAGHVMGTSQNVSGAAEQLASEVQAFFVKLRNGPLDRRKGDDSGYCGPERRSLGDTGQTPGRAVA